MRTIEQGTAPQWDGEILSERNADGDGVEQKYEEVVKWFRKATEQGNASAQHGIEKMMK